MFVFMFKTVLSFIQSIFVFLERFKVKTLVENVMGLVKVQQIKRKDARQGKYKCKMLNENSKGLLLTIQRQ